MGAPSDQFILLRSGGPLGSDSSHTIWGLPISISSLTVCRGPPQINLFAYYRGPLRSVSSHTIWGPHQINFFACYMGAPYDQFTCLLYVGPLIEFLRILYDAGQFLPLLYGAPLSSLSSLTIWGPPQINFFAYYRGPLRSVSSQTNDTIWGPPQINFFHLLYRGPLRSISLRTMYGSFR